MNNQEFPPISRISPARAVGQKAFANLRRAGRASRVPWMASCVFAKAFWPIDLAYTDFSGREFRKNHNIYYAPILLSIACLLSLSPRVNAMEPSELLQAKLNALKTMKAHFTQQVNAKKRELSHSSGEMALSRPGRFRWQTKQPMQQIVIADGQQLWVYDVDLEQVSVKKQAKMVGGTAGLFLSGSNDSIARDFEVRANEKGNQLIFDLKAKSNKANIYRVQLIFEGAALHGMALYDQLGQVTDVSLSQVQVNPKLSARLFQFKVPHGVDVVEQ